MSSRLPLLLSAALVLAGCGSAKPAEDRNLDALDAELTDGNAAAEPARDPALMSALQSQIMVDPALTQQANTDAVRPADQPYSAQVPSEVAGGDKPQLGPLMKAPEAKGDCPQCEIAKQAVTLGGLAARQQAPGTANCVGGMRYSATWANRLPTDLPLFPQARLSEAAGNATGGCALRAVSFSTSADVQSVLDYYYTKTRSVGYAAGHQTDGEQHVLGGKRSRDGAAFVLYASPRDGGGTDIDLIANNGS